MSILWWMRITAATALLWAALGGAGVYAPAAAAQGEAGFDVSGAGVHEEAVRDLHALGVLEGTECSEGGWCWGSAISREVAAVWMVRVLDGSDGEVADEASRFADVDGRWAGHVERLAVLGVTVGCSAVPARFCPDDAVSRGQMASFLVRAYGLGEAPSAGFADTADNVHEAHIDAMFAAGVTAGCALEPLRFCPDDAVTRAQMASFLKRARSLNAATADATADATDDATDDATAEPEASEVRTGERSGRSGDTSAVPPVSTRVTADATAEPEASEVRTGERSGRSGETSAVLLVSILDTCRPPLPDEEESPLGVDPNPTVCIPHRCIHERVFLFLNLRERVLAFLNTGNQDGNTLPAFANSTQTVALPEHSAAGTMVGTPITATDADRDDIEYSLYCGYGDWMKIDSGTGQLRTAADPILFDYESTVNLWFYVVATDGNGGAGVILVDVNLTDVAESPTVPAMPTATESTPTSLTVQWPHVQQRPGVPAVTSYELQYRAGMSGTWKTDSVEAARPVISAGPVGNARQITGLVANTEYQVQVQSTNAEGVSGWSPTLTARTSSAASTAVAYAANALNATKMAITAGNLHDRSTTYSGQGYRVTWTAPTNSPTAQAVQVSGDGNTWSSTPCTRYTINCQVSIGATDTMFDMFVQNHRWLRVFSDHAGTANDSYSENVALPWP